MLGATALSLLGTSDPGRDLGRGGLGATALSRQDPDPDIRPVAARAGPPPRPPRPGDPGGLTRREPDGPRSAARRPPRAGARAVRRLGPPPSVAHPRPAVPRPPRTPRGRGMTIANAPCPRYQRPLRYASHHPPLT